MGALRARAGELVGQLAGAGIKATADVDAATADRPCLLVPPPRVDYHAQAITWRLALLSSHDAGTSAAWDELDGLLGEVAEVLPLDLAEPGSYALPTGGGSVPAYLLTLTSSL